MVPPYHLSWMLYVVHPEWTNRLNTDFEDHALHQKAWDEESHKMHSEDYISRRARYSRKHR